MRAVELPSILSGVAGEYYVAAELSRRGIVASISLRNTRGTDILATDESAGQTITIQVKTSQKKKREWLLSEQSEKLDPKTHFYVFVNLAGLTDRPEFFIVPSAVVAAYAKEDHRRWLAAPSPTGRARNENAMRKFRDTEGRYLEKWELLGF